AALGVDVLNRELPASLIGLEECRLRLVAVELADLDRALREGSRAKTNGARGGEAEEPGSGAHAMLHSIRFASRALVRSCISSRTGPKACQDRLIAHRCRKTEHAPISWRVNRSSHHWHRALPRSVSRAQRSTKWCAADPGRFRSGLWRSRISGAPLHFVSRCTASGTRSLLAVAQAIHQRLLLAAV